MIDFDVSEVSIQWVIKLATCYSTCSLSDSTTLSSSHPLGYVGRVLMKEKHTPPLLYGIQDLVT